MNDSTETILKIKVEGETEAIPAESFIDLFEETLAILKDLDARISHSENGVLDWEIVEARLNSPLLVSVRPTAVIGNSIGEEVIDAYLRGIADLERGAVILPEHFSFKTVQMTKRFASAFNRGIRRIAFSKNAEIPIEATKRLPDHASVFLEQNTEIDDVKTAEASWYVTQQPAVEEKTVLVGKLETISVHGKNPSFVIYDPLTNTKIDCFFKPEDFEDIQRLLSLQPNRVEVTGTAKFNKAGKPTSITVEEYRKLRDQGDLPQFRDLEGINLSGELDPTDYIRRLRDE